MKFTEFLKTVLTKKELNRFYKEVQEYNPDFYKVMHKYSYDDVSICGCMLFSNTRKGREYWWKLNRIVENKKEKLIQ